MGWVGCIFPLETSNASWYDFCDSSTTPSLIEESLEWKWMAVKGESVAWKQDKGRVMMNGWRKKWVTTIIIVNRYGCGLKEIRDFGRGGRLVRELRMERDGGGEDRTRRDSEGGRGRKERKESRWEGVEVKYLPVLRVDMLYQVKRGFRNKTLKNSVQVPVWWDGLVASSPSTRRKLLGTLSETRQQHLRQC